MATSRQKEQLKQLFRKQLFKQIQLFNEAVSTDSGDWIVKGFIDIARNIYTISADTKVISKIIELLLFESNYGNLRSFFRSVPLSILT